jgi:hypothetical protein
VAGIDTGDVTALEDAKAQSESPLKSILSAGRNTAVAKKKRRNEDRCKVSNAILSPSGPTSVAASKHPRHIPDSASHCSTETTFSESSVGHTDTHDADVATVQLNSPPQAPASTPSSVSGADQETHAYEVSIPVTVPPSAVLLPPIQQTMPAVVLKEYLKEFVKQQKDARGKV